MPLRKIWVIFLLTTLFTITWSTSIAAAEFSVMRPGKLNIPRDIKRVFIDPENINGTNDKLSIKQQVLQTLKDQLNDLGRFRVIIGTPSGFDPNKETVAVIQGDIISGGESVDGQMTEKAECVSGITGLIGAASAASNTRQGITVSRRGMLCKRANFSSVVVESGISSLLRSAGVDEKPRKDEVIRVYKYKNISLFAQVNLSLTQIGQERETLTIRSDAASFSRHIIDPATFRNVRESGDSAALVWLMFKVVPVAPVINRNIGVVSATNPGSSLGRWYNFVTPSVESIDRKERERVINQLIHKAIQQFIQTVSPYRVTIHTDVAKGGNSQAVSHILSGRYDEARRLLENANRHQDLYNRGLAFEASAMSIEDYQDALLFYGMALDKSPGNRLYAAGVGRMETQLRAYARAKQLE